MSVQRLGSLEDFTDCASKVCVRIRQAIRCLCRSWAAVDGDDVRLAILLHKHLVFVQLPFLYHLIWDVRCFVASLHQVRVFLCHLFHFILECLHLFRHHGCAVVSTDVVREHRLPLICNRVILQPHIADTRKVARMVAHKVQHLLFHQYVAVALHYRTFRHRLHICYRIVSLGAAPFGCLYRCVECAVAVRQISVGIRTCRLVESPHRDIIRVHTADVVVCLLREQTALIQLPQRIAVHLVYSTPQFIYV